MNPFLRLRHAKEIIGGEKQSLKNFTVSGKEMYDEVSKTQAGSFYIYGANKENLFGNQEPLKMVIFSLILVTYTFDFRKIL